MCLIIETNVFASVFNPLSKEHHRFAPVLKWITVGKGKMIYGGDKYKAELRVGLYTRILVELDRKGKLVQLPAAKVNKYEAELRLKVSHRDFDDPHILAMVAVSKCCVVCTDDKRSIPYLKRRDLYPVGVKPPKIYQSLRNANLCCEKHVISTCW